MCVKIYQTSTTQLTVVTAYVTVISNLVIIPAFLYVVRFFDDFNKLLNDVMVAS